jgi:hypothetical protein
MKKIELAPAIAIFKKIALFALLVGALDFLIGEGLRGLYFRRLSGDRADLFILFEKTRAPILIFGSSRAKHHYVPSLIQAALGEECFYAGADGAFIEYHRAVLEAVLARYTPATIILDLSSADLRGFYVPKQALPRILPFYRTHPEIRSAFLGQGLFERTRLASHIYPFNSTLPTLILNNLSKPKETASNNAGYVPIEVDLKRTIREKKSETAIVFDDRAVGMFEGFLARIKEKRIRLFIFISPTYEGRTPKLFREMATSLCRRAGVPLFDMSLQDGISDHPEYFQDAMHLNENGARVYTNKIIAKIISFH